MIDIASVRFRQKTATPVIGTESFRVTARPNLHPSITDHREFDAVAVYFAKRIAEIVCRPACPVEKDINADELFLRSRFLASRPRKRFLALAVFPGFQNLRRLSQSLDNRLCKLLRPDLLFTDFLVVDVVSVNAVLDRS